MRTSLIVLSFTVALLGCGTNTQIDDGSGGQDVTLVCGVVDGGDVRKEINTGDGTQVRLTQVFSGNTVAVEELKDDGTYSQPFLVKLQGLKDTPAIKRNTAVSRLQILGAAGLLSLFRAEDECTGPASGGGTGVVGHLVNGIGQSLSEELVKSGLVDVEINDACGGDKIGGCLAGIAGQTLDTAGEMTSFLWKPVSESDGNLAVHTGPFGTDVYVNGEKGRNQGPGNGYGSLARFSRPGCAYGAPTIQVYDGNSGLLYTVNGQTSLTVSNPCGRHCLTGGSIQPCSK